jgi:hypothetical protein
MIFQIDFKTAQSMFFDRKKVLEKVDARSKRVLSRFGAYVRRTSRQSIRKRKGTSQAGQPPFSHTGVLRRFIFFGYDSNRRSVVIGAVKVSGKSGKAPSTLEHGGRVTLPQRRNVTISPRPFMQPAFEKELPKVKSLWRDSIK